MDIRKAQTLPYTTQALHCLYTLWLSLRLAQAPSCIGFALTFSAEVQVRVVNLSKYVIAFFAECSTKVRVFCFPAKKSTNYFTLNRNNNIKENNSVEIKYERMKE